MPDCIYANAEGYEAIGDFERRRGRVRAVRAAATRSGLRAARRAPRRRPRAAGKKGKAPRPRPRSPTSEASRRSGRSPRRRWRSSTPASSARASASSSRRSKDREHYLRAVAQGEGRGGRSALSIVDLHERMGTVRQGHRPPRAVRAPDYRSAARTSSSPPRPASSTLSRNKVCKNPRTSPAAKTHPRLLRQALPRTQQDALEQPALEAVGRAQYREERGAGFQFYARLKLHLGRPARPGEGLQRQHQGQERVAATGWRRSLHADGADGRGRAGHLRARTDRPGLREHGRQDDQRAHASAASTRRQEALRTSSSNQAQPLKDRPPRRFASAVAKSRELDVCNDCATKSLKMLRTTYRPDQFPPMLEEKAPHAKGRGSGRPRGSCSPRHPGRAAARRAEGRRCRVPPGKPVVSREPQAADETDDGRQAICSRADVHPTVDALRRSLPASESKPKKPSTDDQEPEDFRQ